MRVLEDADALGIDVFNCTFKANVAIASRDGYIGIDFSRLETQAEVNTVLSHEMGHILSGAFYHPENPFDVRGRAESRADSTAFRRYVPYDEMLMCFKRGVTQQWELAEHFGLTEESIIKAYLYYKDVCGYEFEV